MDTTDELLEAMRALIRARAVTQQGLADACGISQGHLSKVLAGKAPLTGRTLAAVRQQLAGPLGSEEITTRLSTLVQDLVASSNFARQRHIMNILEGLLAVLRTSA
jgi:transcriptional regulator with XRE-family HTH domain